MYYCKECLYFNTSDCRAENCPVEKKRLRKATFQEVMELMEKSKISNSLEVQKTEIAELEPNWKLSKNAIKALSNGIVSNW